MKDVRQFVPPEVYKVYGEKSWQFVSDNIVKLYDFTVDFFTNHFKSKDLTVETVEVVVNDYHKGGTFRYRGLRTVDYINDQIAKKIKTAKISQHIGGSTNAMDFNVCVIYKGGRRQLISSGTVFDIIVQNAEKFMAAGLTTLEDKKIATSWTHADCRFTGIKTLYIVEP